MRIHQGAVFDGPSLYAAFPAIWLRILRERDDPAEVAAGALAAALGQLPALGFGPAEDAEKVAIRLAAHGTAATAGHLVAALALEMQRRVGADLTLAVVRDEPAAGSFDVAFAFEFADLGALAGRFAVALLNLAGRPGQAAALAEVAALRRQFLDLAEPICAKPQGIELIRIFRARDIPVRRLHPRLWVLGQGRFRRHLDYTVTGNTRTLGTRIANDKRLANRVLGELGLPVTAQVAVDSGAEAVRAAARLGYPVVLKPSAGSQGLLVFVGLADAAEVETAYARISEAGHRAILERMVPGDDHRLLVVDGELAAATRRRRAHVVGDGRSSVAALVEAANRDLRRGDGPTTPMVPLVLDGEAERLLRRQGLAGDSVPEAGRVVDLNGTGNISHGAISIDVTDTIHPDVREMALRAAAFCDIGVLGIDFITPDIARSYREVGGAICEVNARPGTRLHELPAEGRGRRVLRRITESVYPPGAPARVCSAAILGAEPGLALALAHLLRLAGHRVGLAVHGDIFIDGPQRVAAAIPSPRAAAMVLGDAVIDAAVLMFTPEDLARHGLGFDGAMVGVALGPGGDHDSQGARRIIADGTREVLLLEASAVDRAALAARLGPGKRMVAIDPSATAGAAAIAHAMGVGDEAVRQGLATLASGFASAPGGFRVLRPADSPVILIDRVRGNAALDDLCRLLAVLSAERTPIAVIDCAAQADRHRAAAALAAAGLDAGGRVIIADTAVDDSHRRAIAEAISAAAGAVLVMTDNPERACRHAMHSFPDQDRALRRGAPSTSVADATGSHRRATGAC